MCFLIRKSFVIQCGLKPNFNQDMRTNFPRTMKKRITSIKIQIKTRIQPTKVNIYQTDRSILLSRDTIIVQSNWYVTGNHYKKYDINSHVSDQIIYRQMVVEEEKSRRRSTPGCAKDLGGCLGVITREYQDERAPKPVEEPETSAGRKKRE